MLFANKVTITIKPIIVRLAVFNVATFQIEIVPSGVFFQKIFIHVALVDAGIKVFPCYCSGLAAPDADKLIHQLYVSLESIKAGNTSKKLRKQVVDLLQQFINHGVIN